MEKKDIKILIVDDSFVMQRIIYNQLNSVGILSSNIDFAKDAFEATFKQRKLNPDIITLDIVLPDKSGMQVLVELLTYNKNQLIVMITSEANKETVIMSKKLGASQYIVKPFKADVFIYKMNKIIDMLIS